MGGFQDFRIAGSFSSLREEGKDFLFILLLFLIWIRRFECFGHFVGRVDFLFASWRMRAELATDELMRPIGLAPGI